MTYLLDVNVLIALCDNYHSHHLESKRWFVSEKNRSWATCPMTQNGFVRITSKPNYPGGHGFVPEQLSTLRTLCKLAVHTFWPDDVTLLEVSWMKSADLVSPSQLTDLYLLALAIKHGGKLVTFDKKIPAHLIRGGKEALVLLQLPGSEV